MCVLLLPEKVGGDNPDPSLSMSEKKKKMGIILTLNFTRGAVEETQIWRHCAAHKQYDFGAI